jgi:copper chaperone CopZ
MRQKQTNQVTNNQLTKKIFIIIGMDCVACAINIDGDLEDREGVKGAKTSYAKAQTEVTYDPEKVTEKEILSIIKQSGYTAKASS